MKGILVWNHTNDFQHNRTEKAYLRNWKAKVFGTNVSNSPHHSFFVFLFLAISLVTFQRPWSLMACLIRFCVAFSIGRKRWDLGQKLVRFVNKSHPIWLQSSPIIWKWMFQEWNSNDVDDDMILAILMTINDNKVNCERVWLIPQLNVPVWTTHCCSSRAYAGSMEKTVKVKAIEYF